MAEVKIEEYSHVPQLDYGAAKRSRYCWVVLGAAFLTQFLNPSVNYAAGVFHIAFLEEFVGDDANREDDEAVIAWVGSLHSSMFALMGPIGSLIVNALNCQACVFVSGILGLIGFASSVFVTEVRLLVVTYAFIAGLGQGCAQVGSLLILGYYFPNNLATVTGIAISGQALGAFVHPPLVRWLLDVFGLSGAFLLVGAFVSHCCIFGLVMRPTPHERARKKQIKSGRSRLEICAISLCGSTLKSVSFLLDFSFLAFLFSTLFFAMGVTIHILYLPDFMKSNGASFQEASWCFAVVGIGSFLSRILAGAVASDERVGPKLVYTGTIGITCGLTALIMMFIKSTGGRIAYGLMYGLYTGGVFSLQSTVCLEICDLENFPLAFGAVMLSFGVGALTGPPIGERVFKLAGTYHYTFVCSSFMFLFSMGCGLLTVLCHKPKEVTADIPAEPEKEPLNS